MISARLLVVAAIKNDINSNSLGYRLVDVVVHAFKDITHESLEEGVRTVGCNFINTKYNMIGTGLKFATRSGTDKEFPVLTLSGKRLLTEDRYTIAYSDSRGNLIAYDAHGTKHIVQPREYLSGVKTFTNGVARNGGLCGNFVTQRLDLDYFRENKLYVPQVYGELMLG